MNSEQLIQSTPMIEVISFRLDGRTYALPLNDVAQIIPMVALTPLPQAHPAIQGVMNFRGRAVPVVNMRRYLNLPAVDMQLHTPIMLVTINALMLGLIVDDVLDIAAVAADKIAYLKDIMPASLGNIPILDGLTQTGDGTVLLFNLEHLFVTTELEALATTDLHIPTPISQNGIILEKVYGLTRC
jgi:purine-binding chemotaxis protein CheW